MAAAHRELVPFEVAAALGVAVAPLPDVVPRLVLLFAVASVARWLRGRSWAEALRGDGFHALVGAAAGLAAAGLVQLAAHASSNGAPPQLAAVVVVAIAGAVAAELALRGWLVDRVLELGGGAVIAVLVGALAEAALAPGPFDARLGGAACGAGLGWIYVAGGRSAVGPICARVAFVLAALALGGARGIVGG